MEPLEKDWQLYRKKITAWQEAYMAELVEDYVALLKEDIPASSKFWALEERINLDKQRPGVSVEMRRRRMVMDIKRLMSDGAITMDDLGEFSDGLRDQVRVLQGD